MNALTAEWVKKAEGDYATTEREVVALERPNYDAVCFHAQQSAEKYLKAYLQEQKVPFPRIHDLIKLLEICSSCDTDFASLRDPLMVLDPYSAEYRYPGISANKDQASEAFKNLNVVRDFARKKLVLQ